MTHDELLAKIDNYTCCSGAHELALRAVVELHKPVDNDIENVFYGTEFPGNICVPCVRVYPCPTIQAIEKELG